jgi:hypothetical protein
MFHRFRFCRNRNVLLVDESVSPSVQLPSFKCAIQTCGVTFRFVLLCMPVFSPNQVITVQVVNIQTVLIFRLFLLYSRE